MVKPVYWISIKIKKHLRVSIEYKNLQNSLRGVFYIWGELHKCPIFYFLFYPYERHSHISHLIDLEFSAVAIADRVGHESIDITYRYSHLFPSKQVAMADRLDAVNASFEDCEEQDDDVEIMQTEETAPMIDMDAAAEKIISIDKYKAV